ncbi:PucR family transcriptional regulator [Dorea formicigenerans]|uniref:PucR family transcriptional regulator n=1 Tax=Dorea formicigenerans TaxID=39486 RepID=UPI00156EA578|nr:PucR family transcriptional regulator [Dorea formicigenerans]NSK19823.1 PucR family transcriptional regulator [Dorea formicigenerans]
MTVEELLQLPTIKGLKLISGNLGVHREISTVTVVDTPDGFQWLKGNEVVITTTYALEKTPNAFLDFISKLLSRNISALIVKSDRYIKVIPENAKKLCDEKALPLIYCPATYAFADIINPTLSGIISKQAEQLKESSKIHESFLELAINDRSIHQILQTLSTLIQEPTAYVDTVFHKVYFSENVSEDSLYLKGLSYEIILNEYREKYQCIDVVNKEQKFGYIMLLSDRSDRTYPDTDSNIYKTAIEYASIVIILRMQIRISNRMIEEKYYSSFVCDLMLNNIKTREEINTRAHLYGWDLDGGGFVAIIDINNIKKYYLRDLDTGTNEKLQKYTDRIFDTSIKCIKQAFPSTIYYSQSDFIAFLITGKLPVSARKTLADTFSQIQHSLLSAVPFTISMGVGMYVDDIINIHNSYQQAKQVIQTVYQIQQFNRLFFYDQIGIYRLLFSISSNNEAIEFCDKYVKPLQQYDDQHHANLIETLQSIINCGWNLKLASEKLFLHYNSVKYRFQKICDLLEIDLRDNSRHTEIELALKIYLIQKNQI